MIETYLESTDDELVIDEFVEYDAESEADREMVIENCYEDTDEMEEEHKNIEKTDDENQNPNSILINTHRQDISGNRRKRTDGQFVRRAQHKKAKNYN